MRGDELVVQWEAPVYDTSNHAQMQASIAMSGAVSFTYGPHHTQPSNRTNAHSVRAITGYEWVTGDAGVILSWQSCDVAIPGTTGALEP